MQNAFGRTINWHYSLCTQNGETALYYATQEGNDEIVQLLLIYNANVNIQRKVSFNHFPRC